MAALHYGGHLPDDTSLLSGIAFAAAGAAAGILVYGIYDIVRKML